jgi:hypothetical protein
VLHVALYWSRCTLPMRLDIPFGYGTRRTEGAAILTANATGYVEHQYDIETHAGLAKAARTLCLGAVTQELPLHRNPPGGRIPEPRTLSLLCAGLFWLA